MKPAICISGLARGNVKRNINHLKKAFPDIPIFFSSWNETKNSISEQHNSSYYPEPQMHYNPWKDCVTDNPHPKYHAYKKMFIDKTFPITVMTDSGFIFSNVVKNSLLFSVTH